MQYVDERVKVVLERSGEWMSPDPEEVELLRFRVQHDVVGWENVADASCCTLLNMHTSASVRNKALALIMFVLKPLIDAGESVKSQAEHLSWMQDEWFEAELYVDVGMDSVTIYELIGTIRHELVMWIDDEWIEDPSIVPAIVNAVDMAHSRPYLLLYRLRYAHDVAAKAQRPLKAFREQEKRWLERDLGLVEG